MSSVIKNPFEHYEPSVNLDRGPIMGVCRCVPCGHMFETPEPPEIICPRCKLEHLKTFRASAELRNGNLPPMVSRVIKGTPGVTGTGVRPRVLGDA